MSKMDEPLALGISGDLPVLVGVAGGEGPGVGVLHLLPALPSWTGRVQAAA
jgi:hypothetical protein